MWFCVSAAVSSAAVDAGVHVSFWKMVFWGYTPSLGMSEAVVNLKFYYYFWGDAEIVGHSDRMVWYLCSFVIFPISRDAEHLVLCLRFLGFFFLSLKGMRTLTCCSCLLESRLCLEFISAISSPGPFLSAAVVSIPKVLVSWRWHYLCSSCSFR